MRRQSGYVLVELAVAAALASLIAVWTAGQAAGRLDDAAAEAAGRWLLELRSAMEQMLAREYDGLAGQESPSGRYADPLAPTVAELKAAGHLAEGFPERSALGLPAVLRVLPAGDCPGAACRLEALAATRTVAPGDPGPDPLRIGQVLLSTGGYGGSVRAQAPDRLRGPLFDLPNPPAPGMAALPAGAVAVYASLDLTLFDRFVRRRDDRDPALRGELSVDGAVQAGGGISTSAGLQAQGQVRAGGAVRAGGNVASEANVTAAGSVTAGAGMRAKGDIAGDAAISAAGRLSTREFLHLRAAVAEGAACSPAGLVARDARGGLLSCQGGAWRGQTGEAWVSDTYEISAGITPAQRTVPLPAGARFCALAQHYFTSSDLLHDGRNFAHSCRIARTAAGQWQLVVRVDTGMARCQAACLR